MSKAFTRESDNEPEAPARPRVSPLPPGAKNYLTVEGARRLREELNGLLEKEASRTGESSDSPAGETRSRILHLQESLGTAVVVEPPAAPWEQVRFGATVMVRERNGETSHYRIVGADETDIERGEVSWVSPIAKALLNARIGQKVRFRFPSGETELEIVSITYE